MRKDGFTRETLAGWISMVSQLPEATAAGQVCSVVPIHIGELFFIAHSSQALLPSFCLQALLPQNSCLVVSNN